MAILDRFVIGAMFGAKAVTYYTVPFNLGANTTTISSALSSALFPRFAAATLEDEQNLAYDGLRTLVVVMTPLIVVGILVMEPFCLGGSRRRLPSNRHQLGSSFCLAFG